jgi:hypothetical protein
MRNPSDLVFLLELAEGMLGLVCAYTVVMLFVYGAPQARAATPLFGCVAAALALLATLWLGAHWHSRCR